MANNIPTPHISAKEGEIAPSILLPAIQKLYDHRSDYIAAMEKSQQGDAISTIIQLIEDASL